MSIDISACLQIINKIMTISNLIIKFIDESPGQTLFLSKISRKEELHFDPDSNLERSIRAIALETYKKPLDFLNTEQKERLLKLITNLSKSGVKPDYMTVELFQKTLSNEFPNEVGHAFFATIMDNSDLQEEFKILPISKQLELIEYLQCRYPTPFSTDQITPLLKMSQEQRDGVIGTFWSEVISNEPFKDMKVDDIAIGLKLFKIIHKIEPNMTKEKMSATVLTAVEAFKYSNCNPLLINILAKTACRLNFGSKGNSWPKILYDDGFFNQEPEEIEKILKYAEWDNLLYLIVDLASNSGQIPLNTILENLKKCITVNIPFLWIKKQLLKDPFIKELSFTQEDKDLAYYLKSATCIAEFLMLYSYGKKLETIDLTSSTEEALKLATNYIVQRENFAKQAYYDQDQVKYGAAMHTAIVQGKKLLENGFDFDGLLSFFASCRGKMALGQQDAHYFGTPQEIVAAPGYNVNTPCYWGVYVNLGLFLRRKLNTTTPSPFVEVHEYLYQLVAQLEGKTIRHSAISSTQLTIIYHTALKEDRKAIIEGVKKLFNKAISETDKDKTIEQAGVIFWWICQSKYWARGDPSIAEMMVRTLLSSKGIEMGSWKKDLVPWEEVMKEFDPQQFGKTFKDLFANH